MTEERAIISGVLPCPVVVLTAAAGDRRDAMTATAFFVSEEPPLVSISVAQHLLTNELIEQSGEFVINLAADDQAEMARGLGSVHGRDADKYDKFGVATLPGEKIAAPRVDGCYASLECRVVGSRKVSGYQVYTAEVVAFAVDRGRRPLLWHQGRFHSLGPPAESRAE